ncbi:MAG: DUF2752 domain-containing protein [Planctomycetes bacterium]|nr:DUF2752 domain-containing protein [Planctomycetota bacterium]
MGSMEAPPIIAHINTTSGSLMRRRLIGGLVLLATATVLGIAAYLEPSPEGLGTHTQLYNMPDCGWMVTMDLPCITCGMTTAFSHAANGNLLASFATQPFGAVLAVITAMVFLVSSYVTYTGSQVASVFGRLWGRGAGWILALSATAAWVYKILAYKGLFG